MKMFEFRTHFDPPPSPSLKCEDASLTRQEFVEESDLNNIMKRYAAGIPLPSGTREPMYGDFSDIPDYARAFQIVQDAQTAFDSLPSNVRERFGNDPGQLLDFLAKKENFDEGVRLGLFNAPLSVSVPPKEGGSGEPPLSVSVPPKEGGSGEPPPTITT